MGHSSYPSNGTPPTANRGPEMGLWRPRFGVAAAHPYGLPELSFCAVTCPPAGRVDYWAPADDGASFERAHAYDMAALKDGEAVLRR